MRAALGGLLASAVTSRRLRDLRRGAKAMRRRLSGAAPTVHFFYGVDDPYSALAAQRLAAFASRYDVDLACHLVPPPDGVAAPQPERLAAYARRDAARLARRLGLAFQDSATAPAPDRRCRGSRHL